MRNTKLCDIVARPYHLARAIVHVELFLQRVALKSPLFRIVMLLCALFLPCAATAANATPNVDLHLSGTIISHSGSTISYLPLDRPVKAGETIQYTIVAKNLGTAPAIGLTPVGRIPEGTTFVRAEPVPAFVHVEYTLDGKTWSAHPTIVVKDPDGNTHTAAAPLNLYKAIRWSTSGTLAPKKSLQFAYEVEVQ
jgi:uncharacterized repeat protein (TIGR01451 family)